MEDIKEYIRCQKFILKSELQFTESNKGMDMYQTNFVDKTIDCIFDSLFKIAGEIDKINSGKK
ncbi:MAG: hypothetical protein ACQEP5_05665 [Actinomycetota bacterium]